MEDVSRIKAYHRRKLLSSLANNCIFVAYAVIWTFIGPMIVGALDGILANRWLVLLAFGLVFAGGYEILSLPLSVYSSYRLEHRFGLSNETARGWVVNQLKTWAVGGAIGGIVLVGLYAMLWYGGQLWAVWLLAGWMGFVVVLAQLFPIVLLPIFYKSTPIADADLTQRLHRLADGTGISLEGVFDFNLSKDTKKANAMLAGLGRTRRVFLSDTLLSAFAPGEIDIVFAHELAHHVRRHIWKGLAMTSLISAGMVTIIVYQLGPYHGSKMSAGQGIAALPTVLVAITLFQLLVQPIVNAVQRRFEVQSDTDALSRTRDPAAYVSAFEKLGRMNLSDPSPHWLIEWFFYDHPALAKRIALAEAFRGSSPESNGPAATVR